MFFLLCGCCVGRTTEMTIKASISREIFFRVIIYCECLFWTIEFSVELFFLICWNEQQLMVVFFFVGMVNFFFVYFILKEYANLHKIKPSLSILNPKSPLPYIEHTTHTHIYIYTTLIYMSFSSFVWFDLFECFYLDDRVTVHAIFQRLPFQIPHYLRIAFMFFRLLTIF